ncbi:MAG: hypothetical protein LBD14_01195 [Puniceicoccales bacterium]|jgi:hypothetical protein|nr:hypothetical protein [Puniceicoccales bacterium]
MNNNLPQGWHSPEPKEEKEPKVFGIKLETIVSFLLIPSGIAEVLVMFFLAIILAHGVFYGFHYVIPRFCDEYKKEIIGGFTLYFLFGVILSPPKPKKD